MPHQNLPTSLSSIADAGPLPQQSRLWNPFPGILFLMMDWQGRANQRADLRDLESHRLDDVGLSPQDQAREVGKPFWRR